MSVVAHRPLADDPPERRRGPALRFAREAEALADVARTLTESLDVSTVAERIVESIRALFGVPSAGFRLLQPDGSLLAFGTDASGAHAPRGDVLAPGMGISGRVALEGAPGRTPDLLSDPRLRVDDLILHRLSATNVRAFLAVPLRLKDAVIGALSIADRVGREFSDAEMALLQTIADQAALALENARLHGETERRQREAEVIAQLARVINASLDLDAVLGRITDGARELCQSDLAQIALRDPGSEAATPRHWVGARSLLYGGLRYEPGKGVSGLVLTTGRPWRTDRYAEDPRISKNYLAEVEAEGIVATLAVPIRIDARVEGVLVVENRTDRPFTDRDEAILVRLADHAAIAIRNARVYGESERRRRLAEALLEIAGALGSAQELKQVLKLVTQRAARLVGADRCSINFIHEGHLVPVMSQFADGHADPSLWARFKAMGSYPLDQVRAHAEAIRTRQPVVIEDVATSPLVPAYWVEAFSVRSALVVPLVQKDVVVGTLNLDQTTGPGAWHPEQIELATAVARQAALAVDNARLLQELRTDRARLEALLEVSRELSRIQPLESLLKRIAEACGQLLGTDSVGLRVLEGDELVVAATCGDAAQAMVTPRLKIGESLTGVVATTGEPLLVTDAAGDPRNLPAHQEALRRLGYRAWLGVPVKGGGRMLGVLSIRTREPRGFSPGDVEIAAAFASQAATALENAQLYARSQAAHDELARTQDQLLQAQKMEAIGRLAGGVAHDFNNLLTIILGRAQMLAHRLGADGTLQRQARLIQQTGERAAALTRQLLAFSRKQVLQPRILDLNAVVAGMDKLLRRLIGEHIELITVAAPDLGRVKADPAQLEQVILNLAVNARDAMPQGGRLVLKTANLELDQAVSRRHPEARPGRYLLLEVSDTGCGMDKATQTRIFEPFFTTKGPGKGTGLGLATVFGIVRQSEGHIWVYSEVGKGSTFKILLPRVEEAGESPDAPDPVEAARDGAETVLLVEDEDELRSLTAEVLEARGYTVLQAATGHEALRSAARHAGPVHLLLTDVVMPQMSGRDLAERLGRERPETRVLYMSGYTDELITHHGALEPGTAFLQKPFTADGLTRKLREVLDAPATRPAAST